MNRPILLIILLTFSFNISWGQINSTGFPFYRYIDPSEYNANDQNHAVAQDSNGLIYVGNVDGILQFDGVNWRNFNLENSTVLSLAVGPDNKIYFGAIGKFGVLEPTGNGQLTPRLFNTLIDSTFLPISKVYKTYCIGQYVYFSNFAKRSSLLKYSIEKNTITEIILPEISFFTFNINGNIYLGNYLQGLLRLENDSIIKIKNGDFFARKNIFSLIPYKSELIVVTNNNGIFRYNPDNGEINGFEDKRSLQFVASSTCYGACIRDENLTVATLNNGIFTFNKNGKIFEYYDNSVGIRDHVCTSVNSFRQDQPLWASLNIGLSIIELNNPIRSFGDESRLEGSINSIIRHKGDLYVATDIGTFILNFDNNHNPYFQKIKGIDSQSFSLCEMDSPNGKILLVGTIQGIYEISQRGTKIVSVDENLESNENDVHFYVFALKYDQTSNILWFNDVTKIIGIRKVGLKWAFVHNPIKISEEEIRSLEIDQSGNIWAATGIKGIYCLKKKQAELSIQYYDTTKGLPINFGLKFLSFRNNLLAITPKGIYKYIQATDRFEPDTSMPQKFYNGSVAIINMIALNTDEVLINFEQKEVKHFEIINLGNKKTSIKSPYINRVGNVSSESYFVDDSTLWFGISNRLFSFNLSFQFDSLKTFNCAIRKVEGRDTLYFMGTFYDKSSENKEILKYQPHWQKPVIKYSQNDLTFHFAAQYYEAKEAIEYSYLLAGYKDNWSKWSKEPKAVFTNLYEGDYTFRVKARNIYGIESQTAGYSFKVLPPWYRTVIAYIFYFLFSILAIFVIVKLYTRKLKLEKIRLEGIVRERTAEIREQRDQIAEQKQSIEDSILYASRIQRAILPSTELAAEILPEHFILFRPRDIVSGDFFWMNKIGDKVIIAAADCTGHGVPGAFMSMLGVSFLNEIVLKENITEAHLILNHLRDRVKRTLKQEGKEGENKDGMDIALVVLDEPNRKLYFAGAYNSMYIFRGQELFELKADRMPIGIYIKEKESFTLTEFDYKPGDTFYIFSDGYADQFGGPQGHKFRYKALQELFASIQPKSMEEQKEILNQTIIDWMGDLSQIDDQVIIGIRLK